MKTKWPPPPNAVLIETSPVLDLVWRALDSGADAGIKFFEDRKKDIDPWLHSHITRFHARDWLIANQLSDTGFELQAVPMSGIWLQSQSHEMRVLKVDRRPDPITRQPAQRIQAPRHSKSRREYFYQPPLKFDSDRPSLSDLLVPQRLRLVILYVLDSQYQFRRLEMACPRRYDMELNVVHVHWWVPVESAVSDTVGEPQTLGDFISLGDIEPDIAGDSAEQADGEAR